MKYLKKFNEEFGQEDFNKWAKAEISKHINFNMLRDIKDMSLEYLDDNLLLEVNVMCPFMVSRKLKKSSYLTNTNVTHKTIYHISFSHTVNNEVFYIENIKNIDMDSVLDTISNLDSKKFIYTINLTKDYDERDEVDEDDLDGNEDDWDDWDDIADHQDPQRDYISYAAKSKELAEWAKEAYPNENIIS